MNNMRWKRSGKILPAFFSLLIALFLAEGMLRFRGYQPGFKTRLRNFRQVNALITLEGYESDSNGITKISQGARAFICNELKTKNSLRQMTPRSSRQAIEVYSIGRDFMQLRDSAYSSPFKTFLENLSRSSGPEEKDFIEAVRNYVRCPINSDGFKSIEFRKYDTKRKSILLLGDSFTWGNSARNKTGCFADLLLTRGYAVYNSGINGADPAQYLQIARVFVPRLKPDFVIANFYTGNDAIYFERKPQPYMPLFYCTNAGYLISCPDGVYFHDAREAYDYTLSLYLIADDGTLLNKLCRKTVITTLLWNVLNKSKADFASARHQPGSGTVQYYPTPYSNEELRQIRKISERHGAIFLLIAIPAVKEGRLLMPQDVPGLFEEMEYFIPPVTMRHYLQRIDGHYNEEGHAIHAAFIDSLCRVIKSR